MKIGKLYRLTLKEKENLLKHRGLGINVFVNNQYKILPTDILIVPLEIHSTTVNGTPLKGENSRRLKVLLSTGDIGTIYLSCDEWEEARNDESTAPQLENP